MISYTRNPTSAVPHPHDASQQLSFPVPGTVRLPPEVLRDPVYQKRMRLMAQEDLNKKDACWLAGIARATWDRARREKKKSNPAYRDFPEDYRPSGKPNGHLRFKTSEVMAWGDKKR